MRERMSSVLKNATSEATRNASDEEQIWESLRGFIVFGLIIEVLILFILSVLDIQYELLGMQIAYTAAIIGIPIFVLGVVALTWGNNKFKK
ncbi:MAG TPA: hypothetical protein QF644_00885 [Candidatus Poseidoniaceae archaeon]|nr:hypothetical protein [Candidatus Poseidoniaceae archaeon]